LLSTQINEPEDVELFYQFIHQHYLTAHSETFVFQDKNGETIYVMLIGKEWEQINRKFDELVLIQTLVQTLYITN